MKLRTPWTIRGQLIALGLVLSVPFMAAVTGGFLYGQHAYTTAAFTHAGNFSNIMANRLDKLLDRIAKTAETLASMDGAYRRTYEMFRPVLTAYARGYDPVHTVAVVDSKGRILTAGSREATPSLLRPEEISWQFEEMKALGKTLISKPLLGADGVSWMLAVMAPVSNEEKIVDRAILMLLRLEDVHVYIDPGLLLSGYSMGIVSESGVFAGRPRGGPLKTGVVRKGDNALVDAVLSATGEAHGVADALGIPVIYSVTASRLATWKIYVTVPRIRVVADFRLAFIIVGCLLLGVWVAAFAFASHIGQSIREAIVRLAGATESLAAGQRDVRVTVEEGPREIQYVANAFNGMAEARQKAEDEIRQLNERLQEKVAAQAGEVGRLLMAIEQAPLPIVIAGRGAEIQYVNARFCRDTGYVWNEVTGRNLVELLASPQVAPSEYAPLQTAMREGTGWSGELYGKNRDGGDRIDRYLVSPIVNEAGELINTAIFIEDIAERRLMTQRLEIFLRFAEDARQGFVIATIDGAVQYTNAALRRMLKLGEKEAVRAALQTYPQTAQREVWGRLVSQDLLKNGAWEGELPIVARDGQPIDTWQNIFLIRGDGGKIEYVAAVLSDNTLQKEIERNLQRARDAAEQARQNLLEMSAALPVAIWQARTQRSGAAEYLFVSPVVKDVLGIENTALLQDARVVVESIAQQDRRRAQALLRMACRRPAAAMFEFQLHGGSRWIRIEARPMRTEGDWTVWSGYFGDITAQRLQAETLERARETAEAASRAKSVFLANMSHEIRTPMNAILGFAQLLQEEGGLSAGQQQAVAAILRGGEHLLALINDVLDMSKLEAGRMSAMTRSFSPQRLIEDVEMMLRTRADAKGLFLRVECSTLLPRHMVADDGKLRQILINLLGNALKFTEHGGVTLRVGVHPPAEPDTRPRFVCEVEDTGSGIADEEQSRLFRPFEQTRAGLEDKGGTGLGLALSREYARLMDGDVSLIWSEPGRGSCFRLELPAVCSFDSGTRAGDPPPAADVFPADEGNPLEALPVSLRARLRTATLEADLDRLDQLEIEAAKQHPAAARLLGKLLREFDYQGILQRL